MNPFKEEYDKLTSILQDTKDKVSEVTNPDVSMVVNRITSQLTHQINFLKVYSGEKLSLKGPAITGNPLKGMFGRKFIKKSEPARTVIADNKGKLTEKEKARKEDADQVAIDELQQKRDDLYGKFLDIDTATLVDTGDDMTIRALAKKVGLPVTEDNPKKITVKFINQIKKAIESEKELASGGQGTEETNLEETKE